MWRVCKLETKKISTMDYNKNNGKIPPFKTLLMIGVLLKSRSTESDLTSQIFISHYWGENQALNTVKLNQHSSKHGPWVTSGRKISSIWSNHWSQGGEGVGVQTADTDISAKQLLTLHIALRSCGTSGFSWGVGVGLETVGTLRHSVISMVTLGPFCSQPLVDFSCVLSAENNVLLFTFLLIYFPVQELKERFSRKQ